MASSSLATSSYDSISKLKTALVTGASSGIGKGIAKELFAQGYTVFAGARRVEAMDDLASLGIHTLHLDVTDDDSVNNVISMIEQETGRLDLLFNNAGTSCTFPGADVTVADAKQCFDVNFFGVIRMTRAAIPLLKESKGTIVQTGSVAAILPFPFGSVYSASKAALHQYSNVLRIELKPFDIKVVVMCVAAVDTNIADNRPLPQSSLYSHIDDGIQARRTMAKDNNPMHPTTFAKHVVPQVIGSRPKRTVWSGRGAWFLWILSLMPKWVIEYIFYQKFYLAKLASFVSKRKKLQ